MKAGDLVDIYVLEEQIEAFSCSGYPPRGRISGSRLYVGMIVGPCCGASTITSYGDIGLETDIRLSTTKIVAFQKQVASEAIDRSYTPYRGNQSCQASSRHSPRVIRNVMRMSLGLLEGIDMAVVSCEGCEGCEGCEDGRRHTAHLHVPEPCGRKARDPRSLADPKVGFKVA